MTNEELVKAFVIELDVVGSVNVYIQGDLDKLKDGVVFLTVHDVGSSFMSWVNFTLCEDMEQIRNRALFIHMSIPGQEPGAKDMEKDFTFPSIDQIALNMVNILDHLRIQQVVGLGDGAGSNILTRFGMHHPNRVHGVMAVNCSSEAPLGYKDMVKEKVRTPEENLNQRNIAKYAESYRKRTEILSKLNDKIKFDFLLVAGISSTKHLGDSEKIMKQMTPGTCGLLKLEKGQGLMPTLTRRMSRQESTGSSGGRRSSMSDMDIPNIGRLIIPPNTNIGTAYIPSRPKQFI